MSDNEEVKQNCIDLLIMVIIAIQGVCLELQSLKNFQFQGMSLWEITACICRLLYGHHKNYFSKLSFWNFFSLNNQTYNTQAEFQSHLN